MTKVEDIFRAAIMSKTGFPADSIEVKLTRGSINAQVRAQVIITPSGSQEDEDAITDVLDLAVQQTLVTTISSRIEVIEGADAFIVGNLSGTVSVYQAQTTTTTTTDQPTINMTFIINGVDFSALEANATLMTKVEDIFRAAIMSKTGFPADSIEVKLTRGSINAQVRAQVIITPSGSQEDEDAITDVLDLAVQQTLVTTISSRIEVIEGADAFIVGNLSGTVSVYQAQTTTTTTTDGTKADRSYVGCFQESATARIMHHWALSRGATPKRCHTACAGFEYFGLTNAKECWCGDAANLEDETSVDESSCGWACTAAPEFKCGSFWKASIYRRNLTEDVDAREEEETMDLAWTGARPLEWVFSGIGLLLLAH